MKNTTPKKPLELKRRTLRLLAVPQLDEVQGGMMSRNCVSNLCNTSKNC